MKRTEHLIIGGGLAGTSLALELASRGRSVVLWDEFNPNSSSRVAAGLINPVVPKGVRKTWKADVIFPLIVPWYRKWEQETGSRFFTPLFIAQLHPDVRTGNEWTLRAGDPAFSHYLKNGDADLPPPVQAPFGYSMISGGGRLDTAAFLEAAHAWLRKHAEIIIGPFSHNQLKYAAKGWTCGELTTDQVTFCEGIRAMQNPWFSYLHFHPTGGDILKVEITALEGSRRDMIYKRRQWLVPAGNGQWLLGSNFHKGETSETPVPADAENLVEQAGKWLQADIRLIEHRRGVRPTVEGRRPYLGTHPAHQGLNIFNGLGSKGSSLIPWLAPMMADYLCDAGRLDPEADIRRFEYGAAISS